MLDIIGKLVKMTIKQRKRERFAHTRKAKAVKKYIGQFKTYLVSIGHHRRYICGSLYNLDC